MKKQVRFFASRRNPLTWLSVAMAIGASALYVLALCFGESTVISTVNIWFQKVLPIFASLLFALLLAWKGEKSFYRTSTAVFLGCVYFAQIALNFHIVGGGPELFAYRRYVILCWVLYLVLYLAYRFLVTGRFKYPIILTAAFAFPFAVLLYDALLYWNGTPELWYLLDKLANTLLAGAIFMVSFAMRPFCDGKYHKTWGDRPDGRRLRSIDGMSAVGAYIMPDRVGASNSIRDSVEISAVERYIHKKRAAGYENFGLTHVLLAAYVRCVAKYPGCNRFISGQRIFQRDEDIAFTMTVKKDMRTDGDETTIKLHLTNTDTADDVYEKLNRVLEEVKNTPLDSSFDKLAAALASLPGLLLKFVVWFLKTLDYFGKIPNALMELSPFHGSVIFTSMGSLGIPPIIHHLYDFGNLPVFLAFGRKYRKTEFLPDGTPVTRRYVDIVLNCDERTIDGFYYATLLKYFHKILRNPEVLDNPPDEVVYDIV